MESFLGHMIAGGVFCLFGGQPLTVLGCTGPVSFHPCVNLLLGPERLSFSQECSLCFPSLPVHPQVLIFEKILVEFCHSYGKLKTTHLIYIYETLCTHT